MLGRLRGLVSQDMTAMLAALDEAGAPWTPGRLPRWPAGGE